MVKTFHHIDLAWLAVLYASFIGFAWLLLKTPFIAEPFKAAPPQFPVGAGLNGYRGMLAICVFFHHAMIHFNYLRTKIWDNPISVFHHVPEQVGMGGFFMMTAYVFTTKIVSINDLDWMRVYSSRVRRIVPLYVFATVVLLLVVLLKTRFTLNVPLVQLFKTILRWFSFSMFGTPDVNGLRNTFTINAGVYWTLLYEWLFYLCLPFLTFLIKSTKWLGWLVMLVVLTLLVGFVKNQGFLYYFVGGIALALFSPLIPTSKHNWVYGLLVLGVHYLLFTFFERAFDLLPAVLVTVLSYGLIKSEHVAWFFTRRPVNWLGYISYSVFLLHGIVITISVIVMRRLHIPWELSNYWAIVAGMGFVVVLTSTMTFQLIERRFWR